jgi:hypothetical protein
MKKSQVDKIETQRNDGRRWTWLALSLIIALGAFFRIYDLGLSAYRADEFLLWKLAERRVPPSEILSNWFEVSGVVAQMPLPAWLAQVFFQMTGWHVTPFTARLPYALMGLLAIPAAYWGGRRFGGKAYGLIYAALVAVNSFHIGMSREAYFYSCSLLGHFLNFWALWHIGGRFESNEKLTIPDLALLAAATLFSGYSQLSGLILCAAVGMWLMAAGFRKRTQRPDGVRDLIKIAGVYAVVLLPLLFVSWGLRPLFQQLFGNVESNKQVFDVSGVNLWKGLLQSLLQFGWGWTAWGWILFVVLTACGVACFVKDRDSRGWWILGACCAMVAMFAVVREASGILYEARYMSWLLPFYLGWVALPLARPFRMEQASLPIVRRAAAAVLAVILGWSCYPAWLQTQITGKPTPYWEILRWANSNFPAGTVILVDRWYEPWNEIAVHSSTNDKVYFTFSVPNEPLAVFLQNRWRDVSRAFLEKNPDAAYLEIAKTYFDAAGVGPWEWPRAYFARHHAITNEAGLKLGKIGLANRGDFFAPNTNRVVVEFFYNTREDVIARWRQENRTAGIMYGAGWGYAKPWQQTGDFRDWRVLKDRAGLDIFNLSDSPQNVRVRLRGAAAGGAKRIAASNGLTRDFANGKLDTWSMELSSLPPGQTQLVFTDVLGPATHNLLLVDDISVEIITGETSR